MEQPTIHYVRPHCFVCARPVLDHFLYVDVRAMRIDDSTSTPEEMCFAVPMRRAVCVRCIGKPPFFRAFKNDLAETMSQSANWLASDVRHG